MTDQHLTERYHRQLILEGFGSAAQDKLGKANVLVVGSGGLGCPVLSYLAGAGVGKIGLVDDGLVELSNLHRQVLYRTEDVGRQKTECAKRVLNQLNPGVSVVTYPVKLDTHNCLEIFAEYDYIIDGLDNFEGKYMINDACWLLEKPFIFAAITRYEGQVAVLNVSSGAEKVNYRDIFPRPPYQDEVMSCNESGVLGILPGIMGCFQANECIKLITGIGEALINKLLTYNALTNLTYIVELSPSAASQNFLPADPAAFMANSYALGCRPEAEAAEIDHARFWTLVKTGDAIVIDLREPAEMPPLDKVDHLRIPLGELPDRLRAIKKDIVIFICQTGARSLRAAIEFSKDQKTEKQLFSLKGGIIGLMERN